MFDCPNYAALDYKYTEARRFKSIIYETLLLSNLISLFCATPAAKYDHAGATLATLVFLRQSSGGPFFDLEAIWDEHTYFEFEVRSVAKTMGTMVVSLFVFWLTLCMFT